MNRRFGVHPDVLKLGLVSFLTDVSSEMIFSVFAIFFTTIAGASSALLGLVEGFADFSASSLDYVAGWLSDETGKRKAFALAGYGFSTLAKVILLVANSVVALSLFRVIERLGKSFRGPPRDAWLAGIAARDIRGYSFGVHKAFDKAGAILGPLVAYGLLSWLGETASSFRALFWVAFVPAVLGVFVLGLIQDQPDAPHTHKYLRGMEDVKCGVQTLPCRSRDFLTGLLQLRLPALACESCWFLSQEYRIALRAVQRFFRRRCTTHRQARRPDWKDSHHRTELSDLSCHEPWVRLRDDEVADHRPIRHLRCLLFDRRGPKQGIHRRCRARATCDGDRCLQFRDRSYLPVCIAYCRSAVGSAPRPRLHTGSVPLACGNQCIRVSAACTALGIRHKPGRL
jgi:hypothetical protein